MTTDPFKEERRVTLTPLFITAAVTAVLAIIALAVLFGFDLEDNQPTPNRPTLAAIIVSAMLLVGLFCVALRDSFTRRVADLSRTKDVRLDAILESIHEVTELLTAFRRQNDRAFVVIHDEVNRLGESHTEELANLANAIKEWGDEQETRGELSGLRRAVGTASVDATPTGKVLELRPTS